jgi:hypothetical protein
METKVQTKGIVLMDLGLVHSAMASVTVHMVLYRRHEGSLVSEKAR